MSKGGPVGEEEERGILAALKSGKSQTQTAKDFNRSPDTINRIAARYGLEYSGPKKAAEVHRYRAREARLDFLAKAIEKAESLLEGCEGGRDFQAIMTGAGITIDKFKAEEPTDPTAKGGEIAELFQKMRDEEAGS
jgi:hypothetical protein